MAITLDFSVDGRRVLISGGTGAIGSAFAKAFLDHGAHVIVADLIAAKDVTNPRMRYEPLDVRDDASVEALARRVETLDVLIHCAGGASPDGRNTGRKYSKTFWTSTSSAICGSPMPFVPI